MAYAAQHPFTPCGDILLDNKTKGLFTGSLPNAVKHPHLLKFFNITLVVESWPVQVI